MSEERQGAAGQGRPAEGAALPLDDTALEDDSTEVSHNNLSQTIECEAAAPRTDTDKWRCEACTYENYPLSRKCTMCRSPKPALDDDIFRLQDGASALPPPPAPPADVALPDAEALAERLKPLRIASGAATSSAAALHKWACPTCTYENWPAALRCAMCGERAREADALWLGACRGVVEGEAARVDAYLAAGGEPRRALLPAEAALLGRASVEAGHTLVHLAIRFRRQEILSTLLARISRGGPGVRRSPSSVAPDLAAAIRRRLAASVRLARGAFPGPYVSEATTFVLPAELGELGGDARAQLLAELVDAEAQRALEAGGALNASREAAPLLALWNRGGGDGLADAGAQAAAGVADRDRTLRAAVREAMARAARPLLARWACAEGAQPERLRDEWARAAGGAGPHRLHVFVLAHVLRRPLLVYAAEARFRGVYLPLLWEAGACSRSPLALGFARGRFSALVACAPGALLPLEDAAGALPVRYLSPEEDARGVLRRWLRAHRTRGGLLACRQTPHARPLAHAQLLEEWLNHYRRLPDARPPPPPSLHFS